MPLRLALAVAVALAAQLVLFGDLETAGVRLDITVAAAATIGLSIEPNRAAWVGFTLGAALDLYLATPFGLSALIYGLTGFGAAWLRDVFGARSVFAGVAIVGFTSLLATLSFALIATVVGEPGLVSARLLRIAAVIALTNVVFAAPLVVAARSFLGRPVAPSRPTA